MDLTRLTTCYTLLGLTLARTCLDQVQQSVKNRTFNQLLNDYFLWQNYEDLVVETKSMNRQESNLELFDSTWEKLSYCYDSAKNQPVGVIEAELVQLVGKLKLGFNNDCEGNIIFEAIYNEFLWYGYENCKEIQCQSLPFFKEKVLISRDIIFD